MPWSLRQLRDHVIQMRTDLISQVIQPGRFSSPENNLTFHIRDRALDGELQGLVLHDSRDPKQVSTFLAERGHIIKQDGDAYLLMENGHILRRTAANEPVRIITFQKYAVDLARFEQKDQGPELKPRERYFSELVTPNKNDTHIRNQPGLLLAELHERFSSPLYPFAFVLIAVAFIGQAQTTRQNRVEGIVVAFLLAMGSRLGGLGSTNVVTVKPHLAWILYAIPMVGGALAMLAAWRRMDQRPRSRLAMWTSDVLSATGERLADLFRRRRQA
jgi:lipopolysaccharide export system permease protein